MERFLEFNSAQVQVQKNVSNCPAPHFATSVALRLSNILGPIKRD